MMHSRANYKALINKMRQTLVIIKNMAADNALHPGIIEQMINDTLTYNPDLDKSIKRGKND